MKINIINDLLYFISLIESSASPRRCRPNTEFFLLSSPLFSRSLSQMTSLLMLIPCTYLFGFPSFGCLAGNCSTFRKNHRLKGICSSSCSFHRIYCDYRSENHQIRFLLEALYFPLNEDLPLLPYQEEADSLT